MATINKNLSSYDFESISNAESFKFGIVVSQWNKSITEKLYQGVLETLKHHGVSKENIMSYDVPGSFELIYGCKIMQKQNVDAIIAIGSVIKGETKHFDFVCHAVSQGIKDLNISHDIPVVFCVLTDDTIEQAEARSGGKHGNKGVEAAVTAIKMAELKHNIS